MSSHLIIVDNLKDWKIDFPEVPVISAKHYLSSPEYIATKSLRVINLSRSYRYLSMGYYCSLLAEARQQKILPSVRTITDLSSRAIYSLNVDDLDGIVHRTLLKKVSPPDGDKVELNIFFGQSNHAEFQSLARQIFDIFPCPLIRVEFRLQQKWQITSIRPLNIQAINDDQRSYFCDALLAYVGKRWRTPKTKQATRYDLAILHDPEERLPPSDTTALQKFVRLGKKIGISVDLITKKNYSRLAEYDALFIRETTSINHHTYRFSKKAEAEGMVVIDDPESIVRCTNKVYLAELLQSRKLPTPKSVVLQKDGISTIAETVGFPAVIKIPDGSFSRGIFKAETAAEAEKISQELFKESDLILAQEFLYTEFDWRIGVLNHQPLFACQYFMSKSHWQIIKHGPSGKSVEGNFRAMPVDEAPQAAIELALTATRLIGDGFYGVDIKQRGDMFYVIEVNDNPNVESGVEDTVLGDSLYIMILNEFVRRLDFNKGFQY
ncbi:MAG: RimK family protein [Gammaproteobacteria bacterium]|nr:RimK family protein [Gammaproteobacteria bacterium]